MYKKKLKKRLLLIIVVIFFNPIYSSSEELSKKLNTKINYLLKTKYYKNIDIGIDIHELSEKKHSRVIYQKNANQHFIPASTIKLLLTGAILNKYNPEYKFETIIGTKRKPSSSVINQDIYIIGKGDPSLTLEALEKGVLELKKMGIQSINGDILFDKNYLEETEAKFSPNARHYYAPSSGLNLNYNTITLKLNSKNNNKIISVPNTKYAEIKLKAKVNRNKNEPGHPYMTYTQKDWGDLYTIRGTITQADINNNTYK
jgi:D-alanyl-D-alanine carboxypeptidase (penicillin-binding protein 4)